MDRTTYSVELLTNRYQGKYIIIEVDSATNKSHYLSNIKKTGYVFKCDYLYAKHMTKKTALKHLNRLTAKEI